MKLFGNRRKGRRVASRKDAMQARRTQAARAVEGEKPEMETADGQKRTAEPRNALLRAWKRLPGWGRGLILLGAALVLLALVLLFVWKMVVKPPDISQNVPDQSQTPDEDKDEDQVFRLPTNVTVIKDVDPDTGEEIEVEVEVPASHKSDYYNILIAGTDADGGRTDTIMIARLDAKAHTVALMSVPRDTLISTSYSVPKINSAYGAGGQGAKGMETLRTQLARLLGFEVDGYVLIDFEAFAELIELVGDEVNGVRGIWFDVPQRMYYSDPTQNLYIDLYAGYQHLNANQCEQLVRYRYGYANADIGRISVQQDFVRALANQCLKIGNITKIQGFVEIFAEYITTDLTVGNMVYFAQELLSCNFDEMETFTLEGENVSIRGGSYYRIFTNKMLALVNEYFNPYDTEITTASLAIPTVSASSSSGSTSGGQTGTTTQPADPAPDETQTPEEEDPAPEDPDEGYGPTEPEDGEPSEPDGGTSTPGTSGSGTSASGTTQTPDTGTDPGTQTPPDNTPDQSGAETPGQTGGADAGTTEPGGDEVLDDTEGYGEF